MRQRPKHAAPKPSKTDVPAELRSTDYGFPRVRLPEQRPHPSPDELRAALDGEPTEQLPIAGVVVDESPKAAHAPGLEPAAAPNAPVLTPLTQGRLDTEEPQAAGPRPFVPAVGAALPARMTAWERELLEGRTHDQAARETRELDEAWRRRIDAMAAYWDQVDERFRKGPEHYVREKTRFDLDQVVRRSAWVRQVVLERPYEFGPQSSGRHALPRRVPGAALAAIEALRGELVAR